MRDAICAPRPIQARLPILIGGSGRQKTLRTVARYADLWNGFGTPAEISATSDVLRERCTEIGRPFEAIERTVTINAVVRDDAAAATQAWTEMAQLHGIIDRTGPDGSERELAVGGPPRAASACVREYESLGVGEVVFVFRAPFDFETIERLAEVRAALDADP